MICLNCAGSAFRLNLRGLYLHQGCGFFRASGVSRILVIDAPPVEAAQGEERPDAAPAALQPHAALVAAQV